VPTIAFPSRVRVGQTFTVTVNSFGSSTCVRADGMDLSVRGDVVDLVPWDLVARGGARVCTDDLRAFPHSVPILAQFAGSLTLRVHGLVQDADGHTQPGTVVAVVTVDP
jgi:hypothetical protein